MSEELSGGLIVARIEIVRELRGDDLIDSVSAEDDKGEPIPLVEALGMLRLAEDTLLREAMGEDIE